MQAVQARRCPPPHTLLFSRSVPSSPTHQPTHPPRLEVIVRQAHNGEERVGGNGVAVLQPLQAFPGAEEAGAVERRSGSCSREEEWQLHRAHHSRP